MVWQHRSQASWLGVALLLALTGCGSGGGGGEPAPGQAASGPAPLGAEAVALERYLKDAMVQTLPPVWEDYDPSQWPILRRDSGFFGSSIDVAAAPQVDSSSTNLQEAGVDEADRVKFGAGHLYVARDPDTYWGWDARVGLIAMPAVVSPGGGTRPITPILAPDPEPLPRPERPAAAIRVLAADALSASANEVALIELSDEGTHIEGMYFLPGSPRDLLVVIATGSAFHEVEPLWSVPYHWENGRTSIHWYDVSDPSAPREIRKLSFQGRIAASRRIDDRLVLVSRHTPSLELRYRPPASEAEADENAAVLEATTLHELLPVHQWDDRGDAGPLVDPEDCILGIEAAEPYPSPSLTTITQVDLRDPDSQQSLCMAGGVDTTYVSSESLYLVSQRYDLAAGIEIRKFVLGEEGPEFRGRGRVPGNLNAQGVGASFQLGEHEGVLGVISTLYTGHPEFFGNAHPYNHRLTLLRESESEPGRLAEVAHLPNEERPAPIGKPDDFLHGVRFMGERIYVVTFRKVDPLYILDVSNPEAPRIAGEVEIPGFSDYLHPVDGDLLLGVGKDTAPDIRNNWFLGVKLELFDVSDPTTLRSIDAEVIGERGSESAVLWDHHAFSFLPGRDGRPDRIAFPVELHDRVPEEEDPPEPNQWRPWTHTGLYLFELTRGEAAAIEPAGVLVAASSDDEGASPSTFGDRSVIQGDALHYVHGEEVWSAPWDDPEDATGPQ